MFLVALGNLVVYSPQMIPSLLEHNVIGRFFELIRFFHSANFAIDFLLRNVFKFQTGSTYL